MFDIGFSELFVIAIVALVVLGPERLPKAARFAGLWVRRARAQWYSVKSELENELADEELRRSLREAQDDLRDAQAALRHGAQSLQQDLRETRDAAMSPTPSSAAPATPIEPPAAPAPDADEPR